MSMVGEDRRCYDASPFDPGNGGLRGTRPFRSERPPACIFNCSDAHDCVSLLSHRHVPITTTVADARGATVPTTLSVMDLARSMARELEEMMRRGQK